MKRIVLYALLPVLLIACSSTEDRLKERANDLCAYIPDHELLEKSRDYMTPDFYAVLDTMFYRLPEHEAMDHEWLYYFVTGNGGTIADYEVQSVEQTDANHAIATILVRQKWPEGTMGDEEDEPEKHRLYMERVNGQWLMSDFDEHKADCIRYIAINRQEQYLRDGISDYLVHEIGSQYEQGDLCVPVLMIVAEEECETEYAFVWGEFWVYNYQIVGDTLKTVSGGCHAGRMTISEGVADSLYVAGFWQTEDGAGNDASARRIFSSHYDIYMNMHSNENVREAVRQEQLREYIRRHSLNIHYYQDYSWPAVELILK